MSELSVENMGVSSLAEGGDVDIAKFASALHIMEKNMVEWAGAPEDDEEEEENEEDERLWDEIEAAVERQEAEDAKTGPRKTVAELEAMELGDFEGKPYEEVDLAIPRIVDRTTQAKIEASELEDMLRTGFGGGLRSTAPMVFDVRDEEFEGGHIHGAKHCRSDAFDGNLDDLCNQVHKEGTPCVVFYCLRSQLKAPTCCQLFHDRLLELYPVEKSTRVCVLKGGFVSFLAEVGPLNTLVEGLDQTYWDIDIDEKRPVYMGC